MPLEMPDSQDLARIWQKALRPNSKYRIPRLAYHSLFWDSILTFTLYFFVLAKNQIFCEKLCHILYVILTSLYAGNI
jgi:hypothetical protein